MRDSEALVISASHRDLPELRFEVERLRRENVELQADLAQMISQVAALARENETLRQRMLIAGVQV
jgi:FtsZ-binding cell division protein ZapB